MKIDLSNKNFLVTGGAGFGVGSGICKAIDNAGGTLVINDLSEEKIQEAISQYKKAIGIRADVSKSEEVKRLFNEIKKQIGPLHGVVNNASRGIGHALVHQAAREGHQVYALSRNIATLQETDFVHPRSVDLSNDSALSNFAL